MVLPAPVELMATTAPVLKDLLEKTVPQVRVFSFVIVNRLFKFKKP